MPACHVSGLHRGEVVRRTVVGVEPPPVPIVRIHSPMRSRSSSSKPKRWRTGTSGGEAEHLARREPGVDECEQLGGRAEHGLVWRSERSARRYGDGAAAVGGVVERGRAAGAPSRRCRGTG